MNIEKEIEKIKELKKEPQRVLGGMVETELSDEGIGYNRAIAEVLAILKGE